MLRYGCTRLEIGVQSVYEDVARDTNRGHTVKATCESFQLAKDAGFKVVSHMMVSPSTVEHASLAYHTVCSRICLMSGSSVISSSSTNTLRTLPSDQTVSRSTRRSSSVALDCTSCGGRGDIRTTRRTRLSILSLAYWPSSRRGRVFTEFSAISRCR